MAGGAGGIRTPYLLTASQTLSQLSYSPMRCLRRLTNEAASNKLRVQTAGTTDQGAILLTREQVTRASGVCGRWPRLIRGREQPPVLVARCVMLATAGSR